MRKEIIFKAFGKTYRTKQFDAVKSMAFVDRATDMTPVEILSLTEVHNNAEWVPLDNRETINEHVKDVTGLMNPKHTLSGVCNLVSDYSFGFLKTWEGAKVPTRFTSDAEGVASAAIDPILAQLIQEGAATLRELEEYYSLQDAFTMFDVLVVKGINKALGMEAAEKEAKNRPKRR
jgi:hypothetical protein